MTYLMNHLIYLKQRFKTNQRQFYKLLHIGLERFFQTRLKEN